MASSLPMECTTPFTEVFQALDLDLRHLPAFFSVVFAVQIFDVSSYFFENFLSAMLSSHKRTRALLYTGRCIMIVPICAYYIVALGAWVGMGSNCTSFHCAYVRILKTVAAQMAVSAMELSFVVSFSTIFNLYHQRNISETKSILAVFFVFSSIMEYFMKGPLLLAISSARSACLLSETQVPSHLAFSIGVWVCQIVPIIRSIFRLPGKRAPNTLSQEEMMRNCNLGAQWIMAFSMVIAAVESYIPDATNNLFDQVTYVFLAWSLCLASILVSLFVLEMKKIFAENFDEGPSNHGLQARTVAFHALPGLDYKV
ncbi:hypothetical protein CVT26_005116 [Gymnopilus dilepis]|uniref:Uncharacterized protein n=1 Tax=Gymnopilus dilepis TaxID=231916 RepID=A0A409WC03_9AGAR|nr:hypothetical protein CVT26_005116 [Gymnopilus dilepis]